MTDFKCMQSSQFLDQTDAYSGGLARAVMGKKPPSLSVPAGKGGCTDVHFPSVEMVHGTNW